MPLTYIFICKGHWKILGVGGAVKVRKAPCHCCSISTDNLSRASHCIDDCAWCKDYICKGWIKEEDVANKNWVCYHHPIITEELKIKLSTDLKELEAEWKAGMDIELTNVQKNSKLRSPINFMYPTPGEFQDSTNICYDLNKDHISSQEKASFTMDLIADLQVRKMFEAEEELSILDLQKKLAKLMKHEAKLIEIQRDITHGELSTENAAYVIMSAVPCSLHASQRNTIKFVSLLLASGVARARKFAPAGQDAKAADNFISTVDKLMATVVFGSIRKPHHWKTPYDKQKKIVTALSFSGEQCVSVMKNMPKLIELCLQHTGDRGIDLEDERRLWNEAMILYNKAITYLEIKTDLTRLEVLEFQFATDQFAQIFVYKLKLNNEGINNYLHNFITGHFGEYLHHHGSLARHNQEVSVYCLPWLV